MNEYSRLAVVFPAGISPEKAHANLERGGSKPRFHPHADKAPKQRTSLPQFVRKRKL